MSLSVLLMLAWLVAAGTASAQDSTQWLLKQEDPDTATRIYLRDRPGALPAFRGTTVIRARLASLAALLLDSSRTQDWVFRVRQVVPLRSDGPTRGVTLVVTAMPFPLSDRESVVAWEMTQDPQTLVVTLAGQNTPSEVPPAPGRVRMPAAESRWTLSPRPDGQVDVVFEGSGDPGGNLNAPVLRQFVSAALWEGPWSTLFALRDIVRQPPFPTAQLPFIREPER